MRPNGLIWAEPGRPGGDPEVKAGHINEWRDHKNWPASPQQQDSSFRLEESGLTLSRRAYVCRAKKQAVEAVRATLINPLNQPIAALPRPL